MASHDEGGRRGEKVDESSRKQRNIDVRILERIEERMQSEAGFRQTIVALGMEEDFLVRQHGREQLYHVMNAWAWKVRKVK